MLAMIQISSEKAGSSNCRPGPILRVVDQSTILRERMLASESLNFEDIYDQVQEDSDLPAELKKTFTNAILASFQEMHLAWPDASISRPTAFLSWFFRRILQLAAGEPVFCFTLNQDLFLERHWPAKSHLPPLELPLLELPEVFSNPPERTAGLQWNLPDIETVARESDSYQQLDGRVHYVKLHGSLGWKDRKNKDRLVIGTRKIEAIRDEPLLSWYFEDLFPMFLIVFRILSLLVMDSETNTSMSRYLGQLKRAWES